MRSMSGPEQLFRFEDNWPTEMGGWFPGERVVIRGKDLFGELNELPWMGLLLYGITGRFFSENQIRLFEGIWSLSSSYPDPRLWNNRVAALAGTARSTTALGIGAATAVSEATVYGRRPDIRVIDFLLRTQSALKDGKALEGLIKSELKQRRSLAGFGRPIVKTDERIGPLLTLAQELGYADGEHLQLVHQIQETLDQGRWRLRMNVAAITAALAADLGLSRHEYYQYAILSFSCGMFPCYLDSSHKPEGTFFPLRCSRIAYGGTPHRQWNTTD